jgi:1H-pyrrole-2-carbonyl-[peptidyl-carrier protein] chlorinase
MGHPHRKSFGRKQKIMTHDFEVGIIGGGPAGSSMACYLAKAGVKCVVFEGAIFPRPHVGESLVPSSTRVFKDLDFLGQMEEAKFPHKFGAVWTTDDKKPSYVHNLEGMAPEYNVDIRFDERQQEGMEDRNYTYHVDRGKFDLMLLQHAQKLGATVYDGVRVARVDFTPDQTEVFFNIGPKEMSLTCKMVVDCSGRQTFLGNQLKLKIKDTVFDQYAIHSWFEGYDRTVFAKRDTNLDYIYIHFLPISNTWIWQIPITDKVTSIGVVTQKKNFAKSRQDREQFFWEAVGTRPLLREKLKQSDQMHAFKDEGDYSYAMKQLCGDRFMLVGDAGRFVDPIFSTGVSIALNSARFAHTNVLRSLEKK